jgi:hypothetical protein
MRSCPGCHDPALCSSLLRETFGQAVTVDGRTHAQMVLQLCEVRGPAHEPGHLSDQICNCVHAVKASRSLRWQAAEPAEGGEGQAQAWM